MLLQFLVHDLRQMRLVIVATYRACFGGDDPLAETFADVVREPGTEWLEMRALGDAEVAELHPGLHRRQAAGRARRGRAPPDRGQPPVRRRVVPMLQAEGRLAQVQPTADWESIPREVRAVIRRRLGLLSKAAAMS